MLVEQGHALHVRDRAEIGQQLIGNGRRGQPGLAGGGDGPAHETAELLDQGRGSEAAGAGRRVAVDGGDDPDRDAGREQGDDEPTDGAERGPGVVGKPASGEEGGRAVGASGHEPGANHGQPRAGDDEAGHDQEATREVGQDLGAGAFRGSDVDEVRELADAGDQGQQAVGPGHRGRDSPGNAQWRDLHSAHGDTGGDRGGEGNPDHYQQHVDEVEGQIPVGEGFTGEVHARQHGAEQEEHTKADGHAAETTDRRFDRRDHRDLLRGGADQAQGREALLAPGCGQAGGRGDEDEHGEQQRQGADGQDDLQLVAVPTVGSGDMPGARC